MPWQRRDIIQFCLLLLCVPLQYFVSGYFLDGKDNDRSQIIISIMKTVDSLKEKIFNFDVWTQNWHYLMLQVLFPDSVEEANANANDGSTGENEGYENEEEVEDENVNDYVDDDSDISSKYSTVKDTRPDNLLYRIGQTVQMHSLAYRGVIIGWEYDKEISDEAIYEVLIDKSHINKDILSAIVQVSQSKLYLIRNFQVSHSYLHRYFSVYDGMQYVPKMWLKRLYPSD